MWTWSTCWLHCTLHSCYRNGKRANSHRVYMYTFVLSESKRRVKPSADVRVVIPSKKNTTQTTPVTLAQKLPNDLFNDSFFQTPAWRWSAVIGPIGLIGPIPIGPSVTGETAILPLRKQLLVAKKELAFSFRPRRQNQQMGGQYANVLCWRQH